MHEKTNSNIGGNTNPSEKQHSSVRIIFFWLMCACMRICSSREQYATSQPKEMWMIFIHHKNMWCSLVQKTSSDQLWGNTVNYSPFSSRGWESLDKSSEKTYSKDYQRSRSPSKNNYSKFNAIKSFITGLPQSLQNEILNFSTFFQTFR